MKQVVIVGAGQAGVQVADSLCAGGYDGAVALVGDESAIPYQRPPLSKDFLVSGDNMSAPLPLRAERFFSENGIDFRRGATATAIDRCRRTVSLDSGDELAYSALVLATGASTRTVGVPGNDLAGVYDLRTLTNAERLRSALTRARSVVVIGAGFIGLEFAAVARACSIDVTVLEAADRPMGRSLSHEIADYLSHAHRRMGTDLRTGKGVAALVGRGGSVTTVVTTSGEKYAADLVLMGVGVSPRDELARAADLPVDNGVLVDEHLRTTDPDVYAAGDCANFPGDSPGMRLRLESVQNATDQGRHVADMIMGCGSAYAELPWFWSNQGSLRLQIAGLAQPDDESVISGDVASGRFSVCRFRDGRLAAVESVNKPADHIAARRILAATADKPTPEQVVDPEFDFKEYV